MKILSSYDLKVLAEDVLRIQRREDSKSLAFNTLVILKAFEKIEKKIRVSGAISENQFDRIMTEIENESRTDGLPVGNSRTTT